MVSIQAFGGYIPRLRLQRQAIFSSVGWFNSGLEGLAKGERAIASWDEDAITMAVEAARDCLGDRDRSAVAKLTLASTSLPNIDRQNSTVVKEALNLPDDIAAFDVTGSQRAGTSALLDALHAAAGGAGATLCIASERGRHRPGSEGEFNAAHGAAAFLIGEGEGAIQFIGGHSVTIDFVDHFRAAGEKFDYQWESRWVRDEGYGKIARRAIEAVLKKFNVAAGSVDHFIMPVPFKGTNAAVAKNVGIPAQAVCDLLDANVGNAGTAHPLVLLSHVLETASSNQIIVLVGFGGGCDVILLKTTAALHSGRPRAGIVGAIASGRPESNYIKYLVFSGLLDLEKGMRAELDQKPVLTALYRERKTVLGLVGGKCSQSGIVQYPKTPISVATDVRAIRTQEDYPLAERSARVLSYTADHLTYSPDPPATYGTIEFEGGGRLMTEFVDLDEKGIEVGSLVRMVFRVKAFDERRGFTKYFWKATPDRPSLASPASVVT
jgi:3-hydroxy-3-methylglutaryl CoA synthase